MNATYKMVTLVGTSNESNDAAIRNAVADAGRSLRNLGWYEVKEMRGRIEGDQVVEYQVKIQIGLKVEEE